MVHRRGFRRSARIPFKIGHTVLLVVLCDTYELHDAYTIICRVLVDFWWWVRFWFSLRDSEKSVDLVSFPGLLFSRLVERFSKCQKRFLLKKLKIVDTHITI